MAAFAEMATSRRVPPELWDRLYPMVRDLRALADRLNDITPELHQVIPLADLSAPDEEGAS
jgi:hypothetical protein